MDVRIKVGYIRLVMGWLFKAGLALTLVNNLTHFSLCISAQQFISKHQRRKLLLIQTRFVKKFFQVYKRAVRKALNYN